MPQPVSWNLALIRATIASQCGRACHRNREIVVESLYLLIPIALVFVVLAIRALFWAVNSGQYDDLNTEGQRILFEEDKVVPKRSGNPAAGEGGDAPAAASDSTTSKSSTD